MTDKGPAAIWTPASWLSVVASFGIAACIGSGCGAPGGRPPRTDRYRERRLRMHFPSMKTPLAVLLLLALAAPAMPARAQIDSREMIELQHQVLDLKREVQNLRDQVARGGGSSSGGSFLGGGRSSSDQSSSGVNDLDRKSTRLNSSHA